MSAKIRLPTWYGLAAGMAVGITIPLMPKLEALLDGLDVTWGVLSGRRRAGIRDEV